MSFFMQSFVIQSGTDLHHPLHMPLSRIHCHRPELAEVPVHAVLNVLIHSCGGPCELFRGNFVRDSICIYNTLPFYDPSFYF